MTVEEIKSKLQCSNDVAEFIKSNTYSVLNLVQENSDYFFNIWNIEDIINHDKDNKEDNIPLLTAEEVIEVKEYILNNIDCNEGITWNTIDWAICEIKQSKRTI